MAATSLGVSPLPSEITDRTNAIKVEQHHVTFQTSGKSVTSHYLEATPHDAGSTKPPVLLLHGMSFQAKTWLDLGTLQLLASCGHRAVAIDLPGFGNSPSATFDERSGKTDSHGMFITSFLKSVDAERPVVISPSMSGAFALPFLMDEVETAHERCSAFIAVAPVNTGAYTQAHVKNCKVKTLIVYGSKDTRIGVTSYDHLRYIPDSCRFIHEGAGHACYMNKPDEWHQLLYAFLNTI